MKVEKEVEALVISALARMNDQQFRRTLKAAFDGRRTPSEPETATRTKIKLQPKKKMHWKTREKLEREKKEKKS